MCFPASDRRKLHKTAEIYNAPVTVGHTFRPVGLCRHQLLQPISAVAPVQEKAATDTEPLWKAAGLGFEKSAGCKTTGKHSHELTARPRGTSLPPVLQAPALDESQLLSQAALEETTECTPPSQETTSGFHDLEP